MQLDNYFHLPNAYDGKVFKKGKYIGLLRYLCTTSDLWREYLLSIIRYKCIDVCPITNIAPGVKASLLMVLYIAMLNSVCSVCPHHLPPSEMVGAVKVQLEGSVTETERNQSCNETEAVYNV